MLDNAISTPSAQARNLGELATSATIAAKNKHGNPESSFQDAVAFIMARETLWMAGTEVHRYFATLFKDLALGSAASRS